MMIISSKKTFIAVVLLLLLAWSKTTECNLPMNCGAAQYGVVSLKAFGRNCILPWYDFFTKVEVQKELDKIDLSIKEDLKNGFIIQPPLLRVFKALQEVPPDQIKVVILGQDPTPQPGLATGLAFSVANPLTVPSVLNVLLEVALEGWPVNINNGDLTQWAKQGVLLLNSALTVRQGSANSHQKWWPGFSAQLMRYISEKAQPSVWLLWGREAQVFVKYIDQKKHYVITGGHPSPIGGRPNSFIGGKYFQCANQFLNNKGRPAINWGLAVANTLKTCPREPEPPIGGGNPPKKPRPF